MISCALQTGDYKTTPSLDANHLILFGFCPDSSDKLYEYNFPQGNYLESIFYFLQILITVHRVVQALFARTQQTERHLLRRSQPTLEIHPYKKYSYCCSYIHHATATHCSLRRKYWLGHGTTEYVLTTLKNGIR
jgi:hypothetical protein